MPDGATISERTGMLTWTPERRQVGGSYLSNHRNRSVWRGCFAQYNHDGAEHVGAAGRNRPIIMQLVTDPDEGGLGFTEPLIAWYRKNKRSLPWRDSGDPYLIWISENYAAANTCRSDATLL